MNLNAISILGQINVEFLRQFNETVSSYLSHSFFRILFFFSCRLDVMLNEHCPDQRN